MKKYNTHCTLNKCCSQVSWDIIFSKNEAFIIYTKIKPTLSKKLLCHEILEMFSPYGCRRKKAVARLK